MKLGFADMEILHNNTASLQELELNGIYLRLKDNTMLSVNGELIRGVVQPTLIHKAHNLKSFKVKIRVTENTVKVQGMLYRWIMYIGRKYTNVNSLEVNNMRYFRHVPVNTEFELPVIQAISNMKNIKHYSMRFCPVTNNILEAMVSADIKLGSLTLWIGHDDTITMDQQLESLISYQQIQCINSLSINVLRNVDFDINILERPLINLSQLPIQNLTSIDLTTPSNMSPLHHHGILVVILENFPLIESLSMNSFKTDFNQYPVPNSEFKSRLKMLKLNNFGQRSKRCAEELSHFFSWVLRGCQLLEHFILRCNARKLYSGELKLDFSNNLHLKSIDLAFRFVVYYTFNKKEGRWSDYDTLLSPSLEASHGNFCRVDLSWRGIISVKLANIKDTLCWL